MSVAAFDLIDWSVVQESLLGFVPLFRMWALKHVSRYCAVGHMQIQWGFWDHDRCPCCHLPNEMTTHLLLCQHPGMKLTWSIQVDTIKDWMEEVDTHPNIIECFIVMLMTRDSNDSFAANSSNFCWDVALAQDKIGWQNLVEGKLSMLWRDLQDEHYSSIGSWWSSSKWAASLATQLLELVHAMWLFRNSILHGRDRQGLKCADTLALENAIWEEFALGTLGLAQHGHHYIHRGRDDVNALSADDKQAWLQGIWLARSSRSFSSADLQCQ